ncbi:PREDICTED: maestro heat-like repeat-containing protein family member 2A, partial [Tinamus guttatus]|uniref:maestro heat-like repeat-containing protein family member 2A n=1 Tax=Tinamus guttatus TaxID=94827 RepID=UPI00052F3A0C
GDKEETYRELENVLRDDNNCLQSTVLGRLIVVASKDMRAAQGVTEDVQTAASNVLVALARSHFESVMCELQCHLRALGEISQDFVFITLGKLASSYVLEQWSKAVNTYLRNWEKCTFPRMREAQFCSSIYPLFCHVVGSWLDCEDEEVKQAVLGAMAAMMGLLLHEEEHHRCVWEQLPWFLGQYQHVQDTLWVTKVGGKGS